MHWRRKWQPTPVFLPGESQGRGSLMGCRLWGRTESDMTEASQQQQQQGYSISKIQKRKKNKSWEILLIKLTQPILKEQWIFKHVGILMSTDFIFYFSGAKVLAQHLPVPNTSGRLLPLATRMHIIYSGSPFNKGLGNPESDRGGWTYWSHKLYRSIRMPQQVINAMKMLLMSG